MKVCRNREILHLCSCLCEHGGIPDKERPFSPTPEEIFPIHHYYYPIHILSVSREQSYCLEKTELEGFHL